MSLETLADISAFASSISSRTSSWAFSVPSWTACARSEVGRSVGAMSVRGDRFEDTCEHEGAGERGAHQQLGLLGAERAEDDRLGGRRAGAARRADRRAAGVGCLLAGRLGLLLDALLAVARLLLLLARLLLGLLRVLGGLLGLGGLLLRTPRVGLGDLGPDLRRELAAVGLTGLAARAGVAGGRLLSRALRGRLDLPGGDLVAAARLISQWGAPRRRP